MSLFISFEGIEGCGKTTQVGLLNSYLTSRGYPCLVTREPGGTKIGDQIRAILLRSENSDLTLKAELFLYMASRVQHVETVILPALSQGNLILCDRFSDSTAVYQGLVQGIDFTLIEEMNRIATDGIIPDITLLIDCPVEGSLQRAWKRYEQNAQDADHARFERKEIDFHHRVRKGYLALARKEPGRIKVIDGDRDPLVIHGEISTLVSARLEERVKG